MTHIRAYFQGKKTYDMQRSIHLVASKPTIQFNHNIHKQTLEMSDRNRKIDMDYKIKKWALNYQMLSSLRRVTRSRRKC